MLTRESRTLVFAAAACVLVVAALFWTIGVGVKHGQLEQQCGPLPGLATTLAWVATFVIALLIALIVGVIGAWRRRPRVAAAGLIIALSAPIGYALGLSMGADGPDPCGFNKLPPFVVGRAQVTLVIDTEPFAGEVSDAAECDISTQSGRTTAINGNANGDPTRWIVAGWQVELRLLELAGPDPELMLALSKDQMPAIYGPRPRSGWRTDPTSPDGSTRTRFEALPLVPGADWSAPREISGSINWTCTASPSD